MPSLKGSCLCGGVKFEIPDVPNEMRFCHCASCKKLSGGVGTANVRVPSASIRILDGEDLLQTFQPHEGSAKTFCLACGANLFGGGWPESETCSVRVTTFEEPPHAKPVGHLYVRSLAPWETLPDDGAERFETTSS